MGKLMGKTEKAVRLRVALLVTVAVGAALCSLQSIACSGSTSSSLIGEWQYESDGGPTEEIFFNSNGTCGVIETFGGQTECFSACTYTYEGDTLTLSLGADGGAGSSNSVIVTVSGDTFTVSPTDGGGQSEQYTRVNASSSNSCP
jgi:hypothetical protein